MVVRGQIEVENMAPELMAHDREKIAVSVMAQPGDPVLDMVMSLRNIEFFLSRLFAFELMRVRADNEAENGESVDNTAGSKKRS